jgi:HTH-type transcriptional regulator, osmoprotectant uptake regulator
VFTENPVNQKMSAKEEFIQLMAVNARANGLDDLSSKIIAILYAEPNEIALEELAKRTGYSLSALSTTLKLAEQLSIVKRLQKPGSKKAYFYIEKNISSMFADMLLKKYEHVILPSKQKLPEIIRQYKGEKSAESKEGAKIAENYYKDILAFDKVFDILKAHFNELARKP